MKKTIWFDMDGTIADLYGVEGWLPMLQSEDPTPYAIAEPLLPLNVLARMLNKLQRNGYALGIISWLAKAGAEDYHTEIAIAKEEWLHKHLPSVSWDDVVIVEYGTPKEYFGTEHDILFDDEEQNRENWTGTAYDVNDIIGILKTL